MKAVSLSKTSGNNYPSKLYNTKNKFANIKIFQRCVISGGYSGILVASLAVSLTADFFFLSLSLSC
jgi:hypothetical protein